MIDTPLRQRVCLNGEWDFMPGAGGQTPDDLLKASRTAPAWESRQFRVPSSWRWMRHPALEHQPFDLFGYPDHWNAIDSGLLQRTFPVERPLGMHTWLIFEGVLQNSCVFVNGSLVHTSTEGFLPFEIDITERVHPGENTLSVWCGSFSRAETKAGPRQLAPNGTWFADNCRGIWQDVYLEYRPAAFIQDVSIRTSTRTSLLEVDIEIGNTSSGAWQGQLTCRVLTGDEEALPLPPREVEIAPGATLTIQLAQTWVEAEHWSPENPVLYRLEAVLSNRTRTLDSHTTRFGFREIWFEGHILLLNGVRTNLRGDAWHYQGFLQQSAEYALNWYRLCRETGINCLRLHGMPYPQCYLDAADEVGMLIIDESAIYGSGKSIQADHPDFLSACQKHLQALVRRDRSHPSVLIWSMQNEMRWVDGREGYHSAMPGLVEAMRSLDPTRAISFDGDNRLVSEGESEIISMHYNIDGTIDGWRKDRPLIFGEHGAFHYISPQVSAAVGGPPAYLQYEQAVDSIGRKERWFIEYGRRMDVTGITPFNTVHYGAWAQPPEDVPLAWPDLTTPGPKPVRVPAYSLTVDNGHLPAQTLFLPNPAYSHIQAGFKPTAIFANEYDSAFFGGGQLQRSFSLYNDTQRPAHASLIYRLDLESEEGVPSSTLDSGKISFRQQPGERREWKMVTPLPDVQRPVRLSLHLSLSHGDQEVHTFTQSYRVYPARLKTSSVDRKNRRVAFFGGSGAQEHLRQFIPGLAHLAELTPRLLKHLNVLILGPGTPTIGHPSTRSAVEEFVNAGGVLLLLQQDCFIPQDIHLAEQAFFAGFINLPAHPLLEGFQDSDFLFWGPANLHSPAAGRICQAAFQRPNAGPWRTLLECGDGDFGRGGLHWSPLVAAPAGRGQVIACQLSLLENDQRQPAACRLLRRLLEYACAWKPAAPTQPAALLAPPKSSWKKYFQSIGVESFDWNPAKPPAPGTPVIVDPSALDDQSVAVLRKFLIQGERIVVLPVSLESTEMASRLAGCPVVVQSRPVYQLQPAQPNSHPCLQGMRVDDLDLIDRVTYTPAALAANRTIAHWELRIPNAEPLLTGCANPWEDYFMRGLDMEFIKIAAATRNRDSGIQPGIYAAVVPLGNPARKKSSKNGLVIFWQVEANPGDEKTARLYAHLLANLNTRLRSPFTYSDSAPASAGHRSSIPAWMALPQLPHHDGAAMLAYFTDANYTLNNLGENAFGWCLPVETHRTAESMPFMEAACIPYSAGKTWYLTTFVESQVEYDPSRRPAGELPDPSRVPDMRLEINAPFELYINGIRLANRTTARSLPFTIPDTLLMKGLNRVVLVCQAGKDDVCVYARFQDKYGASLAGLRCYLTLD